MRLAYLALWVVGCGTEEGTLLTVRAPGGPDQVARLEIVLANADPATITTIEDQRVAPTTLAGETARYYRQRATAGVIDAVGAVDGFTVRIEPNVAMVPEKTFIPFLVAYDVDANVTGVGAVLDLAGEPTTVNIESGATVQYMVDMVALAPMDPALGMGDRESMHVQCGTDRRWTSGIAWRPGPTQFRLLLADRSEDEAATDASARLADLDCDGYVADRQDCDDLRAMFHPGMPEQCDGIDANCDYARTVVQDCAATQCAGGGVQLCDDRTGEPVGACVANAECACQTGQCNQCTLLYRDTATADHQAPCAPGVGKLSFPACLNETAPCTIEVAGGSGPWVAYLAPQPTGPFSPKLTSVTTGVAYLEVKLAGTSSVMAQAGAGVGSVNLVVTQSNQSQLVPVALWLSESGAVDDCPSIDGTGTHPMECTP